ncbi:MAG TPA: LEA type 2 family protein [Thermoanaerobaculia bacterium]|nr:LEA type 2 family protein [Thermoanaerobaculia bacterium]
MKPLLRLLFAFSLLALSGCVLNTLAHMESPTVNVTGVKLLGTSLAGADVLVQFQVENPNDVALTLDGITYKLHLNGEPLLDGQFDKQIQIAAGDRTAVELPVTIRFADLTRVIATLQGKKNPEYALDADLRFAVPVLGEVTVPVTQTGKVPVDRLLQQIGG